METIELKVPDVPVHALRNQTMKMLSKLLNPEKVLVNENGLHRDWRGLFTLSKLDQSYYTIILQTNDKTEKLLNIWIEKSESSLSIKKFQHYLEVIDRCDVCDDIAGLLVDDANYFLSKSKSIKNEVTSDFQIVRADPDNDVITKQDFERRENGFPLMIYDAFVIYNDKDVEFASELCEKMENQGFKLCVKDRDLLGGLSFESDAILNLLSNRCYHLIIIVSKAFLKSPMQIFIANYAQALGIEQGKRKIIPCLLEPCDLPQMFRFCFRLEYYRNNKLFDFWEKLNQSLKSTQADEKKRSTLPELDTAASMIEVDSFVEPLYDREKVYKFTETPTPNSSKTFFKDAIENEACQILPPQSKTRIQKSASVESLQSFNVEIKKSNKLSQSSFYLNEANDIKIELKKKKRKWYKLFMPPKELKTQKIEEKSSCEQPWYRKKKKERVLA